MSSTSDQPNTLVSHVVEAGRYDAFRTIGNQLVGLLTHHERNTDDDEAAERLRSERRDVRTLLQQINPTTEQVDAAAERWAARVLVLADS